MQVVWHRGTLRSRLSVTREDISGTAAVGKSVELYSPPGTSSSGSIMMLHAIAASQSVPSPRSRAASAKQALELVIDSRILRGRAPLRRLIESLNAQIHATAMIRPRTLGARSWMRCN